MSEIPYRPELAKLKGYIPGKSAEEAGKEAPSLPIVKLASNENPLGPSPKAIAKLRELLSSVSVYPDQHASLLREALAEKYGLTPNHLIIGNGSDEIMQLIPMAYLNAGEEAIISRHTFSVYEFATILMGGTPVFTELLDGRYDLAGMFKKIGKITKLVWICNPNNPTGGYVSEKELRGFLEQLPSHAIAVVDEAYHDYAEAPDFPQSLQYIKDGLPVIILRTFSKIYGLAGLRVGYAIAKPSIIQGLQKVKLPFNVNRLAQSAAIEALNDRDHVKQSLAMNSEGKKYLYEFLSSRNLKCFKTEANFICFDVPHGKSADDIFAALLREGVIVRPLGSFHLPKSIRVTIGTKEQNARFSRSLEKVMA